MSQKNVRINDSTVLLEGDGKEARTAILADLNEIGKCKKMLWPQAKERERITDCRGTCLASTSDF